MKQLALNGNGGERHIPTDDELLTRAQVAARWQCHEETVSRTKELKAIRFNERRLRYRLSDVIAVEQECAA